MIEFDYTLTVDMGTEKRTHRPPEGMPKKLNNIFRLQGPNSSGKSTLMNMIALASHGLKKGKIPNSVKSRMEELVKPGYKDLEFELYIQDPVTKRALKSTKKMGDPEVVVRESTDGGANFSIIAADQFEKKYNLIYDIPENPVGRLNELIREIKDVQNSFGLDIQKFQHFVENLSDKINNSRSPEEIKALKDECVFKKEQMKAFNLNADKTHVEMLNKLMIACRLKELDNIAKEADSLYRKFDKENKNSDDSKIEKRYNNDIRKLNSLVQNLKLTKVNLVTEANKCNYRKIEDLKDAIDKIGIDSEAILKSKGIPGSVVQQIKDVKNFANEIRSSSESEALKAMSELIGVLRQYIDKNLTLPQIGPLDEFLKNYQETYRQMNSVHNVEVLNSVVSNTVKTLNLIEDINTLVQGIVPPEKNEMESFETATKEQSLKMTRDSANNNRSNYVISISLPAGINLSNLDKSLTEFNSFFNGKYVNKRFNEIKEDYEKHKNEYDRQDGDRRKIERRIKELELIIEAEEKKGKSEYAEYASEVKKLQNQVGNLLSLYNEAKNKLKMVDNKSYGNYSKEDPFFKSVWVYLGKRLKNVRHLDKEYVASEVDLIDGVITTQDTTKIRLSDMGTGQSQLSYLKGLLSADDKRMIIALFDEVSTMTDSTLGVLLEEFEKLQKEGKLMVGMTVSPADEIKVDLYGI